MKNNTFVIGHKNPDSDSICSAIALAELKKLEGVSNIEAARAGEINPQTSFILSRFNIPSPRYLSNVYPRARDIMTRDAVSIPQNTPLIRVMELMRDNNIRFVPVLDSRRRPVGVLAPMDIARQSLSHFETESSREVFTSIKNITETLGARTVTKRPVDDEKTFSVYVGAMEKESFLKVIGEKEPDKCIVIVGDREEIQQLSVEKKVGALIVTGGLDISEKIVNAAREKDVSIMISPFDSATTALMVKISTPVYHVCRSNFETASEGDLTEELKQRLASSSKRGIIVLNNEGAMAGIITKSNLLRPSGTGLILVDHNELSQAVDGADMVTIDEVVDHHRLGNFHTVHPIRFICEPVGSTSTMVAEMYRKKGIKIRKDIAGLLLSGIISDTIILKSPTTTDRDRNIVVWLEEKSGLCHEVFGKEIFAATASLKKTGAKEAVEGDYKTFETKGKMFGIGQVETIGFDEFYEEKESLAKELERIKKTKDLKMSALLVTDIVKGTSLLLVAAESEINSNLGYTLIGENLYELKNVLSRKKQVAPHLLGLFNEIY
ncbi:MAG: putative manganese-dependent inorganic diphosphatase [bacterium]|nr:putative manganese-dependent inorganic diphosphatase [bacterium]